MLQLEHDLLKQQTEGMEAKLAGARGVHARLKQGWQRRKHAFRELRHAVEENVTYRFNTFLKRRRMKGQITIDYNQNTLEMQVSCRAPHA